MFLVDKSSEYKNLDHHVNLFPSTLKQNIIEQAASRLLEHVTFNKKCYHITQNTNGNAFDEHHRSLNHMQRKKKDFRRTKKCNSWLSKVPTKSDTSLNRLPILINSSWNQYESHDYSSPLHFYSAIEHPDIPMNISRYQSSRIPQHPLTLSSNAATNIHPESESFSQPLIMIHKKRLRRDDFLSTMQKCIQPPYSQNHFYLFDQINMLKLQRNLRSLNSENPNSNLKRKYSEDYQSQYHCSDNIQLNRIFPSKKDFDSPMEQTSPKTADHISINKYHHERKNQLISEEKPDIDLSIEKPKSEQSHVILTHLEKILNLCGELRSLANDVEVQLNEQTLTKTNSIEMNEKNPIKECDSEQTIIDIYKELESQQIMNEKDAPPSYQQTHETTSIHSGSNKSIQLMQTESFKTKSPSLTTSFTRLRKSEDICSCFLKSFLEKQNCELNIDEQEYLNELTKAYILGREQMLKEQQEASNKFQAFLNETLPEESDDPSSFLYDTNNNNQSITPISPSSVLFHNHYDQSISIPPKTKNSLMQNSQPQLPTLSDSISIKQQLFIDEPIAMKATNVLPGIGIKYAQQLNECGFPTVRRLLGFYLMIKDDQHFVIWLNNNAGIAIHSAWSCTNALRAWCHEHL